jgi:hypothetical protein
MNVIFNKEKYFAKNEQQFLTYLHKKNGTKITRENLSFAFNDLEGNGYYKWDKDLSLPISRMSKMQEYLVWLSKGISKDEYLKAIDIAETCLTDGLKNAKGVAKIGFVLHELKDRCNMILHDELFYNILAVQIIRHDESPSEFNVKIHEEKVDAFKVMDNHDDSFFLNIQEYLGVFGLLNTTKIQLDQLLKESRTLRMAMERMLSSL